MQYLIVWLFDVIKTGMKNDWDYIRKHEEKLREIKLQYKEKCWNNGKKCIYNKVCRR